MAIAMEKVIATLVSVLGLDLVQSLGMEWIEGLSANACERWLDIEAFEASVRARRVAFGGFPTVLKQKLFEMVEERKALASKTYGKEKPKEGGPDSLGRIIRNPARKGEAGFAYKGKPVMVTGTCYSKAKDRAAKAVWYSVESPMERVNIEYNSYERKFKVAVRAIDGEGKPDFMEIRSELESALDFVDQLELELTGVQPAADAVDEVMTEEPARAVSVE